MPKISELSIADALDISNDDLLVIVDKETSTTRKIAVKDFAHVVAKILGIQVEKDAGKDNIAFQPSVISQTCGETINRSNAGPMNIDKYAVAAAQALLTFAYNTYTLSNSFTVVAESDSFFNGSKETNREILFQSGLTQSNKTVNICKPLGYTRILVYVEADISSSHSYTLTCTDTACSIGIAEIPLTPTPTSAIKVTATPTPTDRSGGYIQATPTSTTTPTPTISLTPSVTPTISTTPTITPTISSSATPTPTPTITVTPTLTVTTSPST